MERLEASDSASAATVTWSVSNEVSALLCHVARVSYARSSHVLRFVSALSESVDTVVMISHVLGF